MSNMVTRNRSRKESIDIDDEVILMANEDITDNEDVVFLRAESKTGEESASLEIESDEEVEYIVENESEELIAPCIPLMVDRGRTCARYVYSVSSIYLFWILLHYFSAHLYVYYCLPSGVYGFLISPFLVAAPHCRAIRWVIQSGGAMMDNMWLVFGTWVCSKIIARGG